MKKDWRKATVRILLFVMCCMYINTCTSTVHAEERTVKIGYIDYEGFINQEEDGTYSGYGVDLLNEISSYTGWNYEFVYDSFSNQLENLKNGKIDFICHAQQTEEREKDYLFSKYSTGAESSVLYCKLDDRRFYYDDHGCLDGITVGFLKGSYQNTEFVQYASEYGFSYQAQYFDTQAEAFCALDEGRVDTVAMGSLGGVDGYRVIGLFGSNPFYFMTAPKNEELLGELDRALGQIFAKNPTFTSDLYSKYYSSKAAFSGLLLTREETEYIAQSRPIAVGIMQGRSPLSYMDDEGNAAGMMVDILNLISRKSGLKFQYQFLASSQTGSDYLEKTEGRLVAGVAASAFSTPNPSLLQSNSLLDASVVFVGRSGMKFDPEARLTVALPAGFIRGEEVVSAIYPNFTFCSCNSNADCLKAIRDGRADVMLQNIYVIRECLQSPLYDQLSMFPAYEFPEDEKIVALPEDAMLMSIINKTISCLTADEKNDIVINNTIGKVYHTKPTELLYKYRFPIAGIGVLLIIVLLLTGAVTVIKQRNFAAMKKMNAQLETANGQLEEAVRQADHANSVKSQFLARMSHEIRTPMNAIVGLTTIARNHLHEAERMDAYLQKIDTSSQVLLNIINDVLDMSAIESDKMKIAESDFDLKQVLTGISTIYYSQCKDKGIQFELGADLTQEMLIGDSLRVNQILLNLVSNAFKFTPAGGKIRVDAREIEHRENTVYICFTVSDTGCGMSEDMQRRLFTPFEQESSQTAQVHGGSGLGLSIAKNLVEMMHGAIRVQSEKGKGTTFTVDMPFQISEKNRNLERETIRKLRALVVDDDLSAQEYTGIILERIGIPYQVVNSGEEALELLKEEQKAGRQFDVCFVDWKMPGMNGLELTRKIREGFQNHTLVIVVSAYDVGEVETEAKQAGADLFVSKPLFQSTVFNLLMQLSGGQYLNETGNPDDYDFTGHKVLLADDNELNREIALELLELVHMEADYVEDGREAVSRFEQSRPGEYDLILMDIQMPNMDGYEAAQAIRAGHHKEAASIPIIAMTANAFSSDISQALAAGMNGHLAKPIDTELLYRMLEKYARRKENEQGKTDTGRD